MSFYQDRVLPHLIHLSMRQRNLMAYRQRVIPAAEGCVLEIGVGSGLNLPLYTDRAERVIGLDPSPKLLEMARTTRSRAARLVELLEGSAEVIPLEDRSIDTVVTTWTLCTIPDAVRALAEMHRVLRPGGRLLFVEHGRSPDPGVRCHLNRGIAELIETAGFRMDRLETGYMKGPKPMTFMYEGSARL